jgi:hypothetical protein
MRLHLVHLVSAAVSFGFAGITTECLAGPDTECPGGGSPGTITITDKKLESSQASSQKELKAEHRCTLEKPADSEGWKVNFVAHLSRAPGSDEVNIVFYEQSPKAGAAREAVQAYPIRTRKEAKVMMANIELKPEEGFKANSKYKVLITRLINGKEEVYARTTLGLK